MRRVVVTGMGALTPIGNDLHEYWKGLVEGVSGCDLIRSFDASRFKTRFACELKGYDPTNYFDRKESRKMDLYAQYAHIAADEALKDSGLDLNSVNKDRFGVIWSSGIGGIETFTQEIKGFVTGDGNSPFQPFLYPQDDRRHRRRAAFDKIWLQGAQFLHCIGMCLFNQWPY